MKKYWVLIVLGVIIVIGALIYIICDKKNVNDGSLEYEILDQSDFITGNNSEKIRGYEIVKKNNYYYLIIYHGEEPVYFDDLKVLNVGIRKEHVTVEVQLPFGGFGDAFSYPKAQIKFNKMPKSVKVIHIQ